MKTKEGILKEHCEKYYYHKGRQLNNDDILPVSRIIPAMQEYEQQAKEEMYLNMQYYMEYCKTNEYVTPQVWIEKHKHF